MLKLHAGQFTIDAAAGDQPRRTISGIAVRYNTEAIVSDGTRVMFAPGSLPSDGPAPKLFMYHDATKVIGTVTERVETEEGMLFSAKVAETVLGSEALVLAAAGALSDVSVGVEPTKFKFNKNGVMVISASKWMELSVVPHGAFDAPILDVAASIHQDEEEVSNNQEEVQEQENEMSEATEAPAVVEASPITQTLFAQPRREFKMPSAGEWISAQMQGGAVAAEMNAKIKAAAPDVVTSDLDGIMPMPILGPIYSGLRGLRPVVDAIGVRAMPQSGKVFIRPVITTNTSISGPQTENATITAGTFVVNDVQITKGIYGGYVELSEASVDWSSPQTTGNVAVTDPADWVAKVYAASVTILAQGNYMPDHLFVSPDVYAQLGTLSDTSDRPLFPQVGPMNAFGSMTPGTRDSVVFGLRLVVDTNFAAKTCIVGAAATGAFENWEQNKGAVQLLQPASLSTQLAYRGYFASKMLDATKFCKIAQA